MNEPTPNIAAELSQVEVDELMRSLLHKEGTWVEWGEACQKLQKAGYNPHHIFEQTGFQASQQNLIIVAAQVYESLVQSGTSTEILNYFRGPRSDVLYEFRILNQEQRASVAEFAHAKQLDLDGAKQVAKSYQDFAYLAQLPEGFTNHPGDATAYQYWRKAKQKRNLPERSRLIAAGLKFAHSQTAREAIEKLLLDFTDLASSRSAPLIPIYRLEVEEELPRIVPIAGNFPLTRAEIEQTPRVEIVEPFRSIQFSGNGSFVPIPGWQVILAAGDPVAIFISSDRLPKPLPGKTEEVLIVIDRQQQQWDVNSYFLVEKEDKLELQWFEEAPSLSILGQVVLVLRPKRIFDEGNITQPWQMDD